VSLKERIKERARELGFDLVGIAEAAPSRHHPAYLDWLRAGYHGTMAYMARPGAVERRKDPRLILPGARSVIVVAVNYYVADRQPCQAGAELRGRIARYARNDDYHDVMKRRLEALVDFMRAEAGQEIQARAYVDTGPVLERELASRAGLGWIGKNTNLIHPRWGSWLLLGEIITNLALEPDQPFERDHCGSCDRCLRACPTQAFVAPRVLDAQRCISYLTIELREAIPPDLRPLMSDWIFGCDVCQDACPWNRKFARPTHEPTFQPRDDLDAPDLLALLTLDEEGFRRRFRGSPIRRAKRRGLLRNVAVALGNLGAPSAIPALKSALDDPEPLVQEHAAWALGMTADRRPPTAAATQNR
jgi:epoxyqueuosine reductase